jgi:arabinofuranosyltransferase
LTRPDAALFVLPAMVVACWTVRRLLDGGRARLLGLAIPFIVGTLPATAWTMFALLYYGFPFPNTAYAKLRMDIAGNEIWAQGVLYLVDSLDRDPVTLTVVVFAAVLGLAERSALSRACAAGLLLDLLYVVSIGGDFMSGRFLAVPLFVAVLIVGQLTNAVRPLWIPASAVLVLVGAGYAATDVELHRRVAIRDGIIKP